MQAMNISYVYHIYTHAMCIYIKHTHKNTDTDTETDRKTDIQHIDRHTDRQTDRQHIDTEFISTDLYTINDLIHILQIAK